MGYLYVSEHHLLRTNLKVRMRNIIRENRLCVLTPPSLSTPFLAPWVPLNDPGCKLLV